MCKEQVKLEDEFDFDLKIYPDRFLQRRAVISELTKPCARNQEKVLQVEARVNDLRRQQAEVDEALSLFQRYPVGILKGISMASLHSEAGDATLPVVQLLGASASCLERNAAAVAPVPPARAPAHPDCLGLAPDAEADKAVELLRSLAETCEQRQMELEQRQRELRQELEEAYRELSKEGYDLFGIWVHQGLEARSGHYLAFIKDWPSLRWMRFSDSSVSYVTWEEVHQAALGGSSSAYVLVYMDSSLAQAQAQGGQEVRPPDELMEEIRKDNQALEGERGSWEEQVGSSVDSVDLKPMRILAKVRLKELRQHAEAVFQHYAGLLHTWEPQKQRGDNAGNPHEAKHRKMLNDPAAWDIVVGCCFWCSQALISLELFLYRSGGEQEVWHYLLKSDLAILFRSFQQSSLSPPLKMGPKRV